MKKFNAIGGMRETCQNMHRIFADNDERIIVGITGPVASGKTRFTRELMGHAEVLGHGPVVPLPFDLWINPDSLSSATYHERFFIDDFRSAIRCASSKAHFLIPRYDLCRQNWTNGEGVKPMPQAVFWEGRIFDRIESEKTINLPGSNGTYVESLSGLPYGYFANDKPAVYVTDGTLIAQKELRDCYDLLIFITAPWVNRVANMVRRFNRNEVFGLTSGTIVEYVDFLVDEAKSCGDEEIFAQLDQDMIKIEYSPMNLSNYLDLWYLKELMMISLKHVHWVSIDEIDFAIKQFVVNLKEEYDPKTLESLRKELEHLILAKHLLCLENKDSILKELSTILK